MVGWDVGGGYDVYARLIARHLGKHLAGNPAIVVRNLPGATGLLMTNQLYNVGKRDGTQMGMPTSNIPLEPRLKLISPDGSMTSHVPLPDRFTTNICFGGKDLRTAYITLSGSGRLIAIDDWPVPGLKLNHEA